MTVSPNRMRYAEDICDRCGETQPVCCADKYGDWVYCHACCRHHDQPGRQTTGLTHGCHVGRVVAPLSAVQRGRIEYATAVQLAAIDLRQAACNLESPEAIMEQIEGVMQECRKLATYLLQRTLSPAEREHLDV